MNDDDDDYDYDYDEKHKLLLGFISLASSLPVFSCSFAHMHLDRKVYF